MNNKSVSPSSRHETGPWPANEAQHYTSGDVEAIQEGVSKVDESVSKGYYLVTHRPEYLLSEQDTAAATVISLAARQEAQGVRAVGSTGLGGQIAA